jgi:hypothetical protein
MGFRVRPTRTKGSSIQNAGVERPRRGAVMRGNYTYVHVLNFVANVSKRVKYIVAFDRRGLFSESEFGTDNGGVVLGPVLYALQPTPSTSITATTVTLSLTTFQDFFQLWVLAYPSSFPVFSERKKCVRLFCHVTLTFCDPNPLFRHSHGNTHICRHISRC